MTLTFDLKDKQGVTVSPENFGEQVVSIKPRDFLTITIKPKMIDVEGVKLMVLPLRSMIPLLFRNTLLKYRMNFYLEKTQK